MRGLPCLRAQAPGQQQRLDGKRRKPAREILRVLLGEQFGRRHQRRLAARLDGGQCSERRDDRLAGADIALHQAQHRARSPEVGLDLGGHADLGLRQREADGLEQPGGELSGHGQRPARIAADLVSQCAQAQLLREQFLEGQAALRGMAAILQQFEARGRRRAVQELQRFAQTRHVHFMLQFGRQQVRQLAVGERRERLRGQVPEAALLDALSRGIHRRQRIHDRLLVRRIGQPVFRVHDLESDRTAADFAEAAQPRAARKLLLLGGGEIEEPQRQETRAVGEPHEQRAAPAEDDLGELDFALDRDTRFRTQRADRHHAGTILVAIGQQEQEVGDGLDAELRQAPGECRADAAQRGYRPGLGRHGTRMQSTSIAAPRGSAATPIVTRAG